jgi:peroxiredoxin
MDKNLLEIPDDLPVPVDDGACDHLRGAKLPAIVLTATDGRKIDISKLPGRTIIYAYPRTGRPDEGVFYEGWEAIPGARGCTPQSCGFRDHHNEIKALGADVLGLSSQSTEFQQEAVERLHLPFAMLSDEGLDLTNALKLPTFDVNGLTLIKRLTLVVCDGVIEHVFYPVFPPNTHAEVVIDWLQAHPTA